MRVTQSHAERLRESEHRLMQVENDVGFSDCIITSPFTAESYCLSARLSRRPHGQTSPNCLCTLTVAADQNTKVALCIFSFMDDVVFSRLLSVRLSVVCPVAYA